MRSQDAVVSMKSSTRTRSFLSLLCVLCCGIGLAAERGMVFIPGGAFSRGRSYDWPDTRLPWYPNPLKDDTPVRKITLIPSTWTKPR